MITEEYHTRRCCHNYFIVVVMGVDCRLGMELSGRKGTNLRECLGFNSFPYYPAAVKKISVKIIYMKQEKTASLTEIIRHRYL